MCWAYHIHFWSMQQSQNNLSLQYKMLLIQEIQMVFYSILRSEWPWERRGRWGRQLSAQNRERSAEWLQTHLPEFSSAWGVLSTTSWPPSAAIYAHVSVSSLVFLLSLSSCLFSLLLWSPVTLQSGGTSSLFRLFSGKSLFSSGVNLNKSNAFLISLNASDKNKLIINESQISVVTKRKSGLVLKKQIFS